MRALRLFERPLGRFDQPVSAAALGQPAIMVVRLGLALRPRIFRKAVHQPGQPAQRHFEPACDCSGVRKTGNE